MDGMFIKLLPVEKSKFLCANSTKRGFAALHDGYERFFKFLERRKNKKIMQKSRLSAYVIRKRACFCITCKNCRAAMITEGEKRYRKMGVADCGKDVQACS